MLATGGRGIWTMVLIGALRGKTGDTRMVEA
jgi:hypothetical protein